MTMTDPFAATPGFTLRELTAAINNLPYAPGRLGEMGLFNERGIPTTIASIEERNGVISLVTPQPRGSVGQPVDRTTRKLHPLTIPHLPQNDQILAAEVQGVRAFGSEDQAQPLTQRRDEVLGSMRSNIDYTIESHRVTAVKGSYMDANGDATSLFTLFGVAQQTQDMAYSPSASSGQRAACFGVHQKIKAALGGLRYSGVTALCSDAFWALLIEDQDVKATYLQTMMAAELRNDPRQAFFYGGIVWEWYSGTSDVKVDDGFAYAVPMGVPNLFVTRYAPADYIETVNTPGLPYYAKAEPLSMGKGWKVESQSNPLNICTRPRAIIKLEG